MSIDRAIKWLLPHENRFFLYLDSIAASAIGAADVFQKFRDAKDRDEFRKIADAMRLKEQETDELAHTLYEELDKSFVTPIDREDLHELAHALDDILDAMDNAAEQIYLFKLPKLTDNMRELVRIQGEAVREVAKCVKRLQDLRQIDEIRVHIIHVNSLENEGDKLYRKSLEALFDNMIDPIELIRQKEILDALEEAIDACENVVNVIRSVVVKMADGFGLLIAVVVIAVIFDYINGFHDTANAIATVVSTNVLHPRTAIILAACFNFVGALTGTSVAKTIGNDITDPTTITQTVVLSALAAAVIWNLITWYFGIPSSSSHALVGGLIGAVLCHHVLDEGREFKADLWTLITSPGSTKVLKGLVISPLAGLLFGFTIMVILFWIVRHVSPMWVNRVFRKLQLVSASLMAHSHGSNDAQKAMGIITMALVAYYKSHPQDAHQLGLKMDPGNGGYDVPLWVIFTCATAMAMGTAAGGWRIMKTMGTKIIKLRPIDGFAAETAGAVVIETASRLGVPVSTTHVIASSIMGVGASKRFSAVRWGVAGNILVAWVLTIPVSALLASLIYLVLRIPLGK